MALKLIAVGQSSSHVIDIVRRRHDDEHIASGKTVALTLLTLWDETIAKSELIDLICTNNMTQVGDELPIAQEYTKCLAGLAKDDFAATIAADAPHLVRGIQGDIQDLGYAIAHLVVLHRMGWKLYLI